MNRQLKGWVAKKKIKIKRSSKSTKNVKQLPKNLKAKSFKPLPNNLKLSADNSKLLPNNPKSVPTIPTPSPISINLIDPAIIFTPQIKKENSTTLVSIFKITSELFLLSKIYFIHADLSDSRIFCNVS